MGQQHDKAAARWKIAAGALALLVSFQLGYSAGSQEVALAEVPGAMVPATAAVPPDTLTDATPASPMVLPAPGAAAAEIEPVTALETPDTELALDQGLEPAAPFLASAPTAGATAQAAPAAAAATAPGAVVLPAAPSTNIGSASKPARSNGPAYAAPVARYGCAENGSCYGDISTATGRPRTTYVRGYHRRDGTYVRSHYRSRR